MSDDLHPESGTRLLFELRPVDGAPIEPRRRAGFQAPKLKSKMVDTLGEPYGGPVPHAPTGAAFVSDMDDATQEGTRGQDNRAATQLGPVVQHHTLDRIARHHQVDDFALYDGEIWRGLHLAQHRFAIELAIRLGARPLNSRALATVQEAVLNAGLVGDAPHDPVKGINLAHEMAFSKPANGRIARHDPDPGLGQRDQSGSCAHARRGRRGIRARMTAAHDDNVEITMFHVKHSSLTDAEA